jgi:phosphoadenosine phosphosulfate reductase
MAAPLRLLDPNEPLRVDLDAVNAELSQASAEDVLEWTRNTFGDELVLTSSFGADSAVMLHLAHRIVPKVRVIFLDTGYLFPETYQFAEELTQRFDLDVRVYSPAITAARQEALYGKLWEGGAGDLERYQRINKIEPMDRALSELAPRAWIAGLRSRQTSFRAGLKKIELQGNIYKVAPILDWSDEDIHHYLRANDLPYHPLRKRGYRSIGDVHSTQPTAEGEDARAGRRLGEHLECGIHLPRASKDESLKSSGL